MKVNRKLFYLFTLIFILILGCNDKPKTLKEYKSWFYKPENGFVKEKKIGGLILKAVYTPTGYLVGKELKDSKEYFSHEIKQIREQYEGGKNFILFIGIDTESNVEGESLLKKSVQSFGEWKLMIEELSFGIQENVKLIVGSDTLSPSMYHFERGYELGQQQRFIFSFPTDQEDDEITLMFDDEHFNTGRSYFNFSNKKEIPSLPIAIKRL